MDQYHITTVPLLSTAEVAQQIQKADAAQPDWARTTFAQRQSFLRSLKAWILRDMDSIVDVACRDTGKIRKLCQPLPTHTLSISMVSFYDTKLKSIRSRCCPRRDLDGSIQD